MRRRSLLLLLLAVLTALIAAPAARAASPIQIVVEEQANPEINQDNFFRSQNLFWDEDERPLKMVLYREITEDVLLPILNPDELSAAEIRRMVQDAMEQWNDLPGNGFEFDESVRYSDLLDVLENPPLFAGLDQWNLITFQNLTVEYSQLDDSGFATAVLFYVNRDVDLEDVIDPSILPFFMEENSANPDDVIFLDLSGDDVADLRLQRRLYPAGEVLDADIIFNESIAFRGFPEDVDDLPPGIGIDDIIGEPDIQALVTRELGHVMGGDSSLIPTSVMYSEFASRIDPSDGSTIDVSDGRFLMNPYVARDLSKQLDARVLAATLYPDGLGGGGITGRIYRGAVVDNTGDNPQGEVLELVPVFVGRPISFTSAALPNDIGSNRGPIRLEANVFTGVKSPGVKQYNSRFTNVTQKLNGVYEFRGLPPASDYGVRLSNDEGFGAEHGAPTIYSTAYEFFSDIGDVTDDWYGGAPLTPIMTAENPSNETAADLAVSNSFVSMQMFLTGQIRAAFTNAEVFNGGHDATFQVISSQGVVESSQRLRPVEEIIGALFGEDDEADALTYAYVTASGQLGVVQTAEIIDFGGVGQADDIRLTYAVTNLAAETITLNSRVVHQPTVQFADTDGVVIVNPPFINGAWQFVARIISPVPTFFEGQDNQSAPRIRATFRIDGPGIDRPTRMQVVSDSQLLREGDPFDFEPDPLIVAALFDDEGDIFPSTFAEIPGVALYYDGRVLAPGQTTTITIVYGFAQYDRIPDSHIPLDSEEIGIVDDDPFVSLPVVVSNGVITSGIDIITNDGEDQPFTFPVPDDDDDPTDPGGEDSDGLDPTDEVPDFIDSSPPNGGIALPDDNLFIFGGALGDVDNDGDLDLFIAVAARAEDDFEGAGLANRLYINRIYDRDAAGNVVYTGVRRFDDVTFGADGVPGTSDDRIPFQQDGTFSAVFGDFDGDGDQDIFVCNFGGPGGSAPEDQAFGRQNRLLINQGGRQGGTLGFFLDETDRYLPGMHNVGPNVPYLAAAAPVVFPGIGSGPFGGGQGTGGQEPGGTATFGPTFDVTTSAVTGDLTNNGLLDIVVGNANIWHDSQGTAGILASQLFRWRDLEVDPPEPIPGDGGGDVVGLYASERILVNRGFAPDGEWLGFRDETLGTDDIFGGGPVFTVTYPDQSSTPWGTPILSDPPTETFLGFNTWDDRLPPVYPNFRGDDDPGNPQATSELDSSMTYALALAPLTFKNWAAQGATGHSLDIFVGNRREPGEPTTNFRPKAHKRSGNNMILMNLDRDGDFVADGYFTYWNTNLGDRSPFLGFRQDSEDWFISTSAHVWTVQNTSTSPAGLTYTVTPMMPMNRFDGDIVDFDGGPLPEIDIVPWLADHTHTSIVGDFDYRGSWQVFNVNILTSADGGLNPGGTGTPAPAGSFNTTFYRVARGHSRLANDFFPTASRIGLDYLPGDISSFPGVGPDGVLRSRTGDNVLSSLYDTPASGLPFPIAGFTMAGVTAEQPLAVGRPQGASVADFNLDGDLDIIISSDTTQQIGADTFFTVETPGQLQYFANNGFARFTELSESVFGRTLPARYMSMLTGDLDNDGDADFIVFTLGEGTRVFYNSLLTAGPNPASTSDFFTFYDATNDYLPPVYSLDISPGAPFEPNVRINATTAVDFSDLNGDGFVDFVVGRGGFNTVRGDTNDLYFGTNPAPHNVGQRHFRPNYATHPVGGTPRPATFSLNDPTTDIALADIDGDGFDDMIVLNRGTPSEVYFNRDGETRDETGDPLTATVYPLDPNGPQPDGFFELAPQGVLPFPDVTTRQSMAMAIGNFNALADGGAGPCGGADGIGRLDIVIGNGPNIRNLLFINNGDGTFRDESFRLPRIINPNTGDDMDDTRDIVTADFDGDGILDLFVLNRFETRLVNGVSTITKERSRLLLGDGFGNFVDVTAGDDGILGTADDRVPLIVGEVTSALVADFDLAGSPTEDLDGDGRLRSHELPFWGRHVQTATPSVAVLDNTEIAADVVFQNAGCVADLDVSVNLAHASMNNVRLQLQSPTGTTVTLFDGLGGTGANMNTTVFDDEAALSITSASPPYGGRFRPQQPLSVFDGEPLAGTWRLLVRDNATGAEGTLHSFSVSIRTPPGTINRVEPFQASYDIFITRAGGASDILLVNDGTGRFTATGGLPSVQASSYHAAAGNVYLRTISQEIGGQVIQRPLVDIVAGIDQNVSTGGAALLYLNSATTPGTFSNASHEIPRVRSTVLGTLAGDDVTGNIRAVHLVDVDRDGDLDLYLGQNGRFTTSFVGATDWMLLNRTIGEGKLNLTRDPNPLQPGIVPGLRVVAVDPGGAARGETRTVRVYGTNLRNGVRVDFGDDIQVLGYGGVTPNWIDVKIRVQQDAELGSRTITVRDEMGLPYKSDTKVFKVLLVPADQTAATAWDLFE